MINLSPSYDNKIAQKYSIKTLDHKVQNKIALQEELGWPAEKKIPILCISTGMTKELGGDLLKEVLPGILSLGVEVVVLGKGSNEYGELFTKLTEKNGHRIAIMKDTDESRRKMYAASDMALFLSDPTDLPELTHSLSYGVVPIAPINKKVQNYNAVQESGNAFLYDQLNMWHCFAAIIRAIETHNFPFDWKTIQRNGMETVK